jgi:hypothetical protein
MRQLIAMWASKLTSMVSIDGWGDGMTDVKDRLRSRICRQGGGREERHVNCSR